MRPLALGLLALSLPLGPAGADVVAAQARDTAPPEATAPPVVNDQELGGHGRLLGVAKWVSLTGTVVAASYGFSVNARADEKFEGIEAACELDPERCLVREQDGSFTDTELEAMYQDVLSLDDRARVALIASQAGLVATAILFILDLRDRIPADVPFEPPRLRAVPGGVILEGRVRASWP